MKRRCGTTPGRRANEPVRSSCHFPGRWRRCPPWTARSRSYGRRLQFALAVNRHRDFHDAQAAALGVWLHSRKAGFGARPRGCRALRDDAGAVRFGHHRLPPTSLLYHWTSPRMESERVRMGTGASATLRPIRAHGCHASLFTNDEPVHATLGATARREAV